MFLAQHYGLPTRLLDWTTNALVALYFSIPDSKNIILDEDYDEDDPENQSVVFLLEPVQLNKLGVDLEKIIDIDDIKGEGWKEYLNPLEYVDVSPSTLGLPISLYGKHIDRRIISQSGCFTLHGKFGRELEFFNCIENDLLHKIIIPHQYTMKIKKELNMMGIDKFFIYQDLNSLASTIKDRELERFKSN